MPKISALGTKGCPRCEAVKPLDAFYVWRGKPTSLCRACQCLRAQKRRAAGLVQAAERARYHVPGSRMRAKGLRQARKWRAKNPEKLRAERILDNEVRKGRVVRQPCEVCGERAQAHHADYDRPLEVQWLCPLHHARQHAVEGRLTR